VVVCLEVNAQEVVPAVEPDESETLTDQRPLNILGGSVEDEAVDVAAEFA
jgi:hypothetical protein